MKLQFKSALARGLSGLLLFSAVAAAQAGKSGPRKEPARPKLVVMLVVDQFRADYVNKFRSQWKGGLRRLVEQGAWFSQAAYPYANTHTCVGHATISTGAYPATHGIAGNTWLDRDSGKIVQCTSDANAPAVSYGAAAPQEMHSAARLLVPTFADALREHGGGATRVVTFSLKARAAIMLAGHAATSVVWHDERSGAWLTSSAYTKAPVAFVQEYIKSHPVEADFGKAWVRSMPESAYFYAGAGPGEQPPAGWNSTFPHMLRGKSDRPDATFYSLWERSPFADLYLAQMVAAAVDTLGLGKGRSTDYLGVSFSTLDLVGHAFGPDSQEVQDVLARLDETLGALFDRLDRAVGRQNYIVAFSADHGVVPVPEQLAAMKFDVGWTKTAEVVEHVNKSLEPILGTPKPVTAMVDSDLYFAPGIYGKLTGNPAAMKAAMDAILGVPGVARVLRSEELRAAQANGDPIQRAAALSYVPGRSGDLFVLQKPYWLWGAPAAGYGTSHGTPYDYDARVPVILMGSRVWPGEYSTSASPADIAPTLAYLCGIRLARADGRVLTEALGTPKAIAKAVPREKTSAGVH